MNITVKVLNVFPEWVVAEGNLDGCVERRFVPRTILPVTSRGPARIPVDEFLASPPATDVDFARVETHFPAIQAGVVEARLRAAGLWTCEDYSKNPRILQEVLHQLLRSLDATTLLNLVCNPGMNSSSGG